MQELLARIRRRAVSNAIAYRDGDQSLTYAELAARIDAVTAATRAVAPPGSVVLIRHPNDLHFAPALLGVLSAGCDAFPVSPESPPAEIESIIARSRAVAAIAEIAFAGVKQIVIDKRESARARRREEETEEDEAGPVLHPCSLRAFEPSRLRVPTGTVDPPTPDAGNLLLLSSGSTGRPKIVRRTAASLDAVCRQMVDGIGIRPDDRFLATVPLCHSYGVEHGLLAPLWAGARVHLVRGLDLPRVMSELSTGGITILPGVPAMFELLGVHTTSFSGSPFPDLRLAYSAGGPLPPSVAGRFQETTGVPVGQIYGATEIGSITYSDADPATAGRPLAGVDLRFDDDRVLVKADSMFDGYLDDPSPVADGYYPTGDLGHLDGAGRLVITGRSTLLIDIGGLKVNPIEVEAVLCEHPGVADSVVIPVRQSETIVRLKAVITPRDPQAPPSPDDVRRFARDRLAGYKVPREIEVRSSLPRSDAGKVLRQQVEA